jgi:hypothetical protein
VSREFTASSSEYLQSTSPPVTAYPFTLACWAYHTNTGNAVCLGLSDASRTNGWAWIGLDTDHSARGGTFGSGNQAGYLNSTTTTTINTWAHICTVNAATDDHRIYLDGGGKNTNSTTAPLNSIDNISVGMMRDSSPGYAFDGLIADAGVWDVALSDDEVSMLAVGYSPLFVRPQNLVFYAPLYRDEDFDRVGGVILTAYNTPTIAAHPPLIYPAQPYIMSVPAAGAPPVGGALPGRRMPRGIGRGILRGVL